MAEVEAIVDRAWAQCSGAVAQAVRDAGHDGDTATVIALGLISRLAGTCLHEIMGVSGRTDLSDLVAADPEEVRWALEAFANLDLEAVADKTSATLVLRRRLS